MVFRCFCCFLGVLGVFKSVVVFLGVLVGF